MNTQFQYIQPNIFLRLLPQLNEHLMALLKSICEHLWAFMKMLSEREKNTISTVYISKVGYEEVIILAFLCQHVTDRSAR